MGLFRKLNRVWDSLLSAFYVGSASTSALPQIDGVRAVAVSILVDHAWGVAGGPGVHIRIPFAASAISFSGWINRGDLGVPLFFILSGFLIPQSWFRAAYTGRATPPLASYFKRRVLRLVPAYYACIFFILVFFTPSLIPEDQVYSLHGLKELAAHLTFTHFWFTETMGPGRSPAPCGP